MSNAKPDFSRDPERVALAKVLREAVRSTFRSVSVPNWETMDLEWKREYLFMADAAIAHLGSGYRLPEATEANAERLARARWSKSVQLGWKWENLTDGEQRPSIEMAMDDLKDILLAFADPGEKPEPVFLRQDQMRPVEPEPVSVEGEFVTHSLAQFEQAALVELCDKQIRGASPSLISVLSDAVRLAREYSRSAVGNEDYVRRCPATLDGKRCNLAVHADDIGHDNGETSWLESVEPCHCAGCDPGAWPETNGWMCERHKRLEPRKMDATERGERRRERQQLVWEMAKQLVAKPIEHGARHVRASIQAWDALIREAADGVDRYLAWRAADDKKDTEAYKK